MSKLDFLSGSSLEAEDFMAEHSAYAKLKRSELDTLSGDKLLSAVTGWIEGKFAPDWSDMCEVINKLPTPCLNLYCADFAAREILDGGFAQAFFNTSRDFMGAAAAGFRAIGSCEAADIIEGALKQHFDSGDISSSVHSIEDFLRISSDDTYSRYDEEFHLYFGGSEHSKRACTYIMKYRKYFGENG